MKNVFIFGFVLLVLSISVLGAYDCYQETATTETDCGGLSTGTYYTDPNFGFEDYSTYWYDGVWDGTDVTFEADAYVNYTIPSRSVGSTYWMIKAGHQSVGDVDVFMWNFSLDSCSSEDDFYVLSIQQDIGDCASGKQLDFYCGATLLGNTTCDTSVIEIWEEGILWSMAEGVQVNIYDQDTGNPITDNVTVSFIAETNQTQNHTSSGSIFVSDLDSGDYTVSLEADNYTKVFYSITVADDSTQTLNAYMPPTTFSDFVTFRFLKEGAGQPTAIEGVSLSVSRIVGSSWVQLFALSSDVTGKTGFYFEQSEKYGFVASKDGYVTKEFQLSPILETSYDVYLTLSENLPNPESYSNVLVYHSPKLFTNDEDNNISFYFVSPTGIFTSFNYTAVYDSTTYSNSSTNANGALFSETIPISGAGFGDEIYITQCYDTTTSEPRCFYNIYPIAYGGTFNYTFAANRDRDYNMTEMEKTFTAVGWSLLWAGGGAIAGGPIGAGVMAFASYATFVTFGVVSIWHVIITLMLIFIIVVGWSR